MSTDKNKGSLLRTIIIVAVACIVAWVLFSIVAAVLGAAFALIMRILSIAVPILIVVVAIFVVKSRI